VKKRSVRKKLSPSRKDEKSDDEKDTKDTKDTSGPTSTKRREKKKRKVPVNVSHEVEDIRAVEEADEDEVKRGLNNRQTSNRQTDK
jgi:hypothetical protein